MTNITTNKFNKIKKKYALVNSYFKNRTADMPKEPLEVAEYFEEHNELPYNHHGESENWLYDCFTEYQKRTEINNNQFFTPPAVAKRMAEILNEYVNKKDEIIIDACCGYGQITKALCPYFSHIVAFDNDWYVNELFKFYMKGVSSYIEFYKDDFTQTEYFKIDLHQVKGIISNPPYDIPLLTEFLYFVHQNLLEGGYACLLLPKNFINKTKPKKLIEILGTFEIKHRENPSKPFARTATKAEIVVLQKK